MATKIIMASYATETNNRLEYAKDTLTSLLWNVDFSKHQLFISDNGSCKEMLDFYDWFKNEFELFNAKENLTISLNGKNLGTAEAVNLGIRERKPNQYVIKIDSDVTINTENWVDEMEECFERYPNLGILGLKRTEVMQKADHENPAYRTKLVSAPHERGQKWIILELCDDIIGTCTMFSPNLLDKIGYLFQPAHYGWDDVLACVRSEKSGFVNAFLPHIPIVHLDNGEGDYVKQKLKEAEKTIAEFSEIAEDYKKGVRDIYYNPFEI
jgi:GT2 family glycosyltransferase